MADPTSPLRTNRDAPSLFDSLSTAGQMSQADQYAANPENQFAKGLRTGAAGLTAGEFASEALRKEVSGDEGYKASRDRALQTVKDTQMYAPRMSSLRDVKSVGDLGDLTAAVAGQGAMSMVPSIAAAVLTRGRGLAGKATAFGGAMVPAYEMERGEAALNQYQDPEQMKASVQDRDLAATAKGGINAALESIVPAGIGGSLLRKPTGSLLGHVGRDALTEGATEAAQQVVGYGAQKYLDPNKQLSGWDIADAAYGGAVAGGGMAGAARLPSHALGALMPGGQQQQPGGPTDVAPPEQAGGVGDPNVPLLPNDGAPQLPAPEATPTVGEQLGDLGAAVNDRFGEDAVAAASKVKDFGTKAKGVVSDTIDRMTEATRLLRTRGSSSTRCSVGACTTKQRTTSTAWTQALCAGTHLRRLRPTWPRTRLAVLNVLHVTLQI